MKEEHHSVIRHRKRKKHFPWLFCLIIITACILVFALVQYGRDMNPPEPTVPTEAWVPADEGDTLTLAAAGDIGISPEILQAALQPDGSYDFNRIFLGVSHLLSDADLTVADLEVNIADEDFTGENCKAPQSLLTALSYAGVDILQTANTASVFNGLGGLTQTYDSVLEAGMKPVGTFPDEKTFESCKGFTMVEKNGFRIAFVAFTKGVGNLQLPQGAESSVNLLYTDYDTTYQKVDKEGIRQVMENVEKAKPDITVALVHWGSEYIRDLTETQDQIQRILLDGGADAILGSHSHIPGIIDTVTTPNTVTAYSLGNLLSSDESQDARESIILKLTFTKTSSGTVLTDCTYNPIYIATEEETGSLQLLDIEKVKGLYESSYIDRVPKELYETLTEAGETLNQQIQLPEQSDGTEATE